MKQYETKPTTVNAIQWDESKKTLKRSGAMMKSCSEHLDYPDWCGNLRIDTCDGTQSVANGDWIVEVLCCYSVSPDVAFTSNYIIPE